MTVILDAPLTPVLPGAVRGFEAMHTWTSPTGVTIVLNDHTASPQYRLERIEGRHSHADMGDISGGISGQGGTSTLKHDSATARMGEIVRRTMLRGKTETLIGKIEVDAAEADPLPVLRGATSALVAAFAEPGLGTMRIEPKPGSGNAAMIYQAEVISCDVPDDQQAPPWQPRTAGFEREFTLVLRLSDPRYVEDIDRTAVTSSIASAGGVAVPVSLPVALPGLTAAAGTVVAHNGGNAPVDPVIELAGYAPNPQVWNDTLGVGMIFEGLTINAGQVLTLDFAQRTINIDGQAVAREYVDWSNSGWWDAFVPGLEVGDNTIRYRAVGADANAIATVRWRNASYG